MLRCASRRHQSNQHDVFLSFRGLDTRKTIVSHLYEALKSQGMETFKDDETIETGSYYPERLREAINTSKCAVVVISENYATSRWCLEELQLITDLQFKEKMVAIPVFYNVDISDVRDHKGKFSLEDLHSQSPWIPSWEMALKRIAETQAKDSRK